MNKMIYVVVCGLLVLLLAGCTEKPEQTTTATGSNAGVTEGVATTEGGSCCPPPGEGDKTATAEAGGEVTEGGEPPVKTTADKLPPEPSGEASQVLVGEWFAIFGSHDQMLMTMPEDARHHIEFKPNGTGRIVKYEHGEPTESTFIKWQTNNDELLINYIAAEAVGLGLTDVVPLGIARDEEAGLIPLGIARDEETGLLKGETGGDVPQEPEFRRTVLSARIEPNYIALRDPLQRMVIYGRMPSGGGGQMPDLSGEWVGHIDMHDNFNATFEVQDDGTVIGTYDHDGGKFVGKYLNGYIVGKVEYGMKFSLAALKLTADWELDGVYSPSPYIEMVSRYDFNRYDN